MNPPIEPETPLPFEDRKTGLVVFGILTVLFGVICALFVLLLSVVPTMTPQAGAPTPSLLPAFLMYGMLAVILIWLGIGSIMARRWARALLLIFAWSWLLMGVMAISMMVMMWPSMIEGMNAGNPSKEPIPSAIMLIPLFIFGILTIAIPGGWILFYRSRHVKATCEARDPVVRWTDRCPLPVLAVCFWLGFSAASMLLMTGAYRSVMPVFGNFVSGPAGAALYLLFACLWVYAAWSLYKLEWRGWWIVIVSILLFSVSAFVTYSQRDIMELYTLMGYPEDQIALIKQYSFMNTQTIAWATLAGMIPFVGYLLYVRKFLRTA